jgi:hypothetical protein
LYGCETMSVTLSEKHRLTASENRVLSQVFGPKMDEEIREWRKLHYEEINGLYFSPNIFRVITSRINILRGAGVWHVDGRVVFNDRHTLCY